MNRIDLMDVFGISVQQASTDLNRYLAMAPTNLTYDRSAKAYIRGTDFTPLFLKPDASRFLLQIRSVADGLLDRADAWIRELPPYDAAPTLVRGVNAKTLRTVVAAIRRAEAVEIKYQSLSMPEPRWRWIDPHAIAFDGFRWHTRAFCETDQAFKDFLLARILDVGATRPGVAQGDADADWHDRVVLQIGPHPALSESQKNIVALDYGMRAGKTEITVRRALLYYALKRLGLDTDPAARQPQDQQIVLLNCEDALRSAQSGVRES